MRQRTRILIVGCGNLGAAMAAAIERALPGMAVIALDHDVEAARARLPADTGISVVPAVAGDVPRADMAILAVKPQQLSGAVDMLAPALAGGLIISVAAGVTLDRLKAWLPHSRLVRAMPNLASMAGAGMTVAVADAATVSDSDRNWVAMVCKAFGRFRWLSSEDAMDVATAVSGSGPGYLFAIAEMLARAGADAGLPADVADELARQTIIGAGRLMETDPRTATALKQAVTSPGGTTEAGLAVLQGTPGIAGVIGDAVRAAAARAKQLSRSC